MNRHTIILFALLIASSQSIAQNTAKIIIKKNIDGEETVIEREYDLEDGEDLSEILQEEDIEMEFDFNDDMMSSFFHFDFDDKGAQQFFNRDEMRGGSAFLGIVEEQVDQVSGVMVSRVVEESTAEEMGIVSGDVILRFNGSDILDMHDLKRLLNEAEVGDEVKVEIDRAGKTKKLKGTLQAHPEKRHGMTRMHISPDHEFQFDSQMNMAELEEMMRQLEDQMQDMEFEFDLPEGDMEGIEKKYRFQYDVPGRHHEMEGAELRFDRINPEDLERRPSGLDINMNDDLDLKGLRFHPLGGSSIFELGFSVDTSDDLSVAIYDAEGKMVYYEMLSDFFGEYDNVIDLNDRPEGNYYLQLSQGGKTFSRKVIKG